MRILLLVASVGVGSDPAVCAQQTVAERKDTAERSTRRITETRYAVVDGEQSQTVTTAPARRW